MLTDVGFKDDALVVLMVVVVGKIEVNVGAIKIHNTV